jgi:7-cyano-7-deazaguanine synthase
MLFTEEQLGKMNAKHAVVSLSGGMDSTTVLLKCLKEFETVTALSFDYGQKHRIELERAQSLIDHLNTKGFNVKYRVIKLNGLTDLLNSALVEGGDEVPEGHYAEDNMKATVVPNRNKIFASITQAVALSIADKTEENTVIAMGIHAGDHAIYPDCRQEFRDLDFEAFRSGNWGSERVFVYTPYLNGDKFTILQDGEVLCDGLGLSFDEVYSRTNTSYKPIKHYIQKEISIGPNRKEIQPIPVWFSDYKSASSVERIEAFIKLGRPDPVAYADETGPVDYKTARIYVEQVLSEYVKEQLVK